MQALLQALTQSRNPNLQDIGDIPQISPTLKDLHNALSGVAAGTAGLPVDLMTTMMRPFGYDEPRPVGGSEWMGEQLGADPESGAFIGGTFGSPDPTDFLKLAAMAPGVIKAVDNLPDGTPIEDALAVMHNMTAENLRHAERMGGMPMPSIGIAKAAHPIEGYGDITLLGSPDMAVPSAKNPVFSSDAYSPRYPKVTEILSDADQAKLSEFIAAPFGVKRTWDVPQSTAGYNKGRYVSDLYDDGTIDSLGMSGLHNATPIKARYLWEKGEMPSVEDYPDKWEWESEVRKRVQGDDPEYMKWAENLTDRIGVQPEEKLFGGWTNAGRKRMIPHTLDNVIKEMRKEMKDSNETNMFGSGALRAKVAPKFRTLQQIKDARGRIKPADELDKDALNNKLFDLSSEFGQYAKYKDSNQFIQGDRVRDQLVEISAGQSRWDDYFDDVPDELKGRWQEYLGELKNAPTAYFEAKPNRAVQLSEFKNALIPESAGSDVADALMRHGLEVERYTDEADKAQKILAKRNLLFQHPAATVLGGSLAAALLAQMAGGDQTTGY